MKQNRNEIQVVCHVSQVGCLQIPLEKFRCTITKLNNEGLRSLRLYLQTAQISNRHDAPDKDRLQKSNLRQGLHCIAPSWWCYFHNPKKGNESWHLEPNTDMIQNCIGKYIPSVLLETGPTLTFENSTAVIQGLCDEHFFSQ